MIPWLPHVPAADSGASHNTRAEDGPPGPSKSIRFSFPSVLKNAIDLPSGDQNGKEPPSAPARGVTSGMASERIHMRYPLLEVVTNATRRPSGETAGPGKPPKTKPLGGRMLKRTTAASPDLLCKRWPAQKKANAISTAPAAIQRTAGLRTG